MGEPDEHGIYPDYRLPREVTKKQAAGISIPWGVIYAGWPNVVADLAQFYSVHWHQCLAWPWPVIRGYVEGLFIEPASRVHRLYIAPRLPKPRGR